MKDLFEFVVVQKQRRVSLMTNQSKIFFGQTRKAHQLIF